MAYAKAVVDFSKYQDGDLTGPSNIIHQKMLVDNAATFPSPPLTAVAFLAIITTWIDTLGESLKGGTDRTTLKNNARTALENALFQLGTFVNLKAQGDQATIDLSGFPSYTTTRVQSTGGVTFIPSNVRWEDGTVSGQEILHWKGDGTHATYEVQTCTGDPNLPANWTYALAFHAVADLKERKVLPRLLHGRESRARRLHARHRHLGPGPQDRHRRRSRRLERPRANQSFVTL